MIVRGFVLVGLILLVGGGCGGERGKTFEGRPASYWREQLKSPNYMARVRAANAMSFLGEEGKRSIPELIALLEDKSHEVRWSAANTLGMFPTDAAAALPLLEKLEKQDTDPAARNAAEIAASRIRSVMGVKKE